MPGYEEQRNALVTASHELKQRGLSVGNSGNVSLRTDEGMLITPSGVAAKQLSADLIVHMTLNGECFTKDIKPSSEWLMHAMLYASRSDAKAIVHCHSNYATLLACAHIEIPAQHYMIAATGANKVALAAYAQFGTKALANSALSAIANSKACLLANHGQLVLDQDLDKAMDLAEQIEQLAFWYWGNMQIEKVNLLNKNQMADVHLAFVDYGQQNKK